jgi:predicted NUDIX family phosphoesterase/adenylate kinase family enzyme
MPENRNFITAARVILEQEGLPLDIEKIVELATTTGELLSEGNTPVNTMRARISEHIRKYRDNSLFVRVGPNKFGLRTWGIEEYDKNPLIKKFKGEEVVCVPQSSIDDNGRLFGFSKDIAPLIKRINSSSFTYFDRARAEFDDDYKQLICYVMLFNKQGEILSFTRGSYSTADKRLLQGALCIGFGGHVNKHDLISANGNYRLLSIQDLGIEEASFRELREELKGIYVNSLEYVGFINDDSSPTGVRHLGIVLKGVLKDNFDIAHVNTERSINKLSFLSTSQIWTHFHELEFWSQLLCKQFWEKPLSYTPVAIWEGREHKVNGPISIVGEIATGKTIIAEFLADKYKLPVISTRSCVADLIGMDDFYRGDRRPFSEKAYELVSTDSGVEKLVQRIIDEIKSTGREMVIIDGIRNIKTYEKLKRKLNSLTTVFVDCPRDSAYEFYKKRAGRDATIDEFRKNRYHEVEKEVPLFKTRANIRIYNAGTRDDLFSVIGSWFHAKLQIPD